MEKDRNLQFKIFIFFFAFEFTNKAKEIGFRQVKRKLVLSFMFKDANSMKDYALILSC